MQTCIGWVELSTRTHQSHTGSILGFALWLRQAMTLRGDLLVCSKGTKANRNRRVKNEPALFRCFVRLLSTTTSLLLLERRGEAPSFNGVAFNATLNHVTSLLEGVSQLYKLRFNSLGLQRLERRQDSAPRALGDRCFDISQVTDSLSKPQEGIWEVGRKDQVACIETPGSGYSVGKCLRSILPEYRI